MKKITVNLSDKAEKYLNEVIYSLEVTDSKGNPKQCTISDAINEILETNADFESVEGQNVCGWLQDNHSFYTKS